MGLEELSKYVPLQYIVWTIIVFIALIVLGAKVYPTLSKWFNALKKETDKYEDLLENVKKANEAIDLINQKIGRDYARTSQLQQIAMRQQKCVEDSLEERELILKSLLGVVQGLQEIGANGPTKRAESDIQDFLLKKSHKVSEEG